MGNDRQRPSSRHGCPKADHKVRGERICASVHGSWGNVIPWETEGAAVEDIRRRTVGVLPDRRPQTQQDEREMGCLLYTSDAADE